MKFKLSQSGMICFLCMEIPAVAAGYNGTVTALLAAMAQEHSPKTIYAATVGVYECKFR